MIQKKAQNFVSMSLFQLMQAKPQSVPFDSGGKREIKTITRVDANKEVSFLISIEKDKYLVAVGEEFVSFERSSRWNFLRYYLKLYFGGKSKASKDLKFKLELL